MALHDVTPAHAPRLERAERLLLSLGITAVTYLLVPNFHGRFPAHADPTFVAWCRARRGFDVDWFLHGYEHREEHRPIARGARSLRERFARRFLTAGEGEFLTLTKGALDARLAAGVESFVSTLGHHPAGFVAPAWLYNDSLFPALQRANVRYTESHFHVFDVAERTALPAPVITWATRNLGYRIGSVTVAAFTRRWWANRDLVRVALHPADFDHERVVSSIARTLDRLRSERYLVSYGEALCRQARRDAVS